MGKPTDRDRVGTIQKRINSANRTYDEWATEFNADLLEEFYYGHQWANETEEWDRRKYCINLFYPAVNISKSSLLFSTPKYKVTPRPTRIDDPLSNSSIRAKLQEDTLNSYVSDPKIGFEMESGLGVLDAMFSYGVAYVGYSADFIDNPQAGKPILKNDQTPLLGEDSEPIAQPAKIPQSEQAFIKWIDAKTFRVSDNCPNRLTSCDWCGYYEWHRIDDLKANPRYKNTSGLIATGKMKDSEARPTSSDEEKEKAGLIQVWFIWDNRAKLKQVFVQGAEKFLLEEKFKFLPFAVLKFNERLGKFYPLPESFNWIHPQRELNDTRETDRIHRSRAKRKYRRNPSVTAEEFAKLQTDEDMVCIETPSENDITAIQDAPLDSSFARATALAQDDFTRVSGISGEAQEVAQSETATQANLIALASKTREASRRQVVGKWLSEVGRLLLLTLVEKMTLPLWIKRNIDPASPLAAQEAQEIKIVWEQIDAEEKLGDIDNDISVEISSLSPMAQEQERTEWIGFLSILTSPVLSAIIPQSPYLLRKTAGLFNIHNERDIMEVGKAMEHAAMMQAMMMAAQAKGSAGATAGAGGGGLGPGPTPSNNEIQGQLGAQLPVEAAQGIQ